MRRVDKLHHLRSFSPDTSSKCFESSVDPKRWMEWWPKVLNKTWLVQLCITPASGKNSIYQICPYSVDKGGQIITFKLKLSPDSWLQSEIYGLKYRVLCFHLTCWVLPSLRSCVIVASSSLNLLNMVLTSLWRSLYSWYWSLKTALYFSLSSAELISGYFL